VAVGNLADQLRSHPACDHTRARLASALLDLGLGTAAEEVASPLMGGELAPAAGEIIQAARRSSGRVSWGRFRDRFGRNLQALAGRGVSPALVERAWETTRSSLLPFLDRAGLVQLRWQPAGRPAQWISGVRDHRAAAGRAQLPADIRRPLPGPYALDGVGLGFVFERLWDATRNTFMSYSAAIHVVEQRPERLALALHLHDWAELIADPRVHWYVGPTAIEDFRARLVHDERLALPGFVMNLGSELSALDGGFAGELSAAIRDFSMEIEHVQSHARAAADALYEDRSASDWHCRWQAALAGSEAPLRVLGVTSMHTTFLQHSMRDCLAALERMGCVTRLLIEERSFEFLGPGVWSRTIREFEPDLLLSFDHLRTSFVGRVPDGLPILTWDQDALPHLVNPETIRQMGPLDAVVGLAHWREIADANGSAAPFLACHMATDPDRFSDCQPSSPELERFACDVSFVGHGSQSAAAFHDEFRSGLADPLGRRLLDALFEIACRHMRLNAGVVHEGVLARLFEQAQQECEIRVDDPAQRDRIGGWYLWRVCDRLFRHEALTWASAWAVGTGRTFHIYGKGWEGHPSLSRFARGPIDNGRDLPVLYRASKLNLQLMPAGFIHPRALDGLCAGGFFLARRCVADSRDRRFRSAWAELRALGADDCPAGQPTLESRVAECIEPIRRDYLRTADTARHAIEFLRANQTLDYPVEVFDRFDEILFDSPESFAQRADRFLVDPAERASIVRSWRETIASRYSYDASLKRFLTFHAAALASDRAPTMAASAL